MDEKTRCRSDSRYLVIMKPTRSIPTHPLPWTQDGAKQLRLYLNADQTLSLANEDSEAAVLYYQTDVPGMNRDDDDVELLFKYTFPKRAVIAGPSKVTVYLSAEKQDDLHFYVMLRKADVDGNILQSVNQPLTDLGGASADEVPAVSVLKYLGPEGMLRASKREVAPELSKPCWPTLPFISKRSASAPRTNNSA
jgi:uncharacterized protein